MAGMTGISRGWIDVEFSADDYIMYFVSVLDGRGRGGGGKEERIYLWIDWIDNVEMDTDFFRDEIWFEISYINRLAREEWKA